MKVYLCGYEFDLGKFQLVTIGIHKKDKYRSPKVGFCPDATYTRYMYVVRLSTIPAVKYLPNTIHFKEISFYFKLFVLYLVKLKRNLLLLLR